MKKLGLDIHGTMNEDVAFFKAMAEAMIKAGHEVHIISGPPVAKIAKEMTDLGLSPKTEVNGVIEGHYTHLASIMDILIAKGIPLTVEASTGRVFADPYEWDKVKGDYCIKHGINLMIDDSDVYGYFFKTPFARYYSKNKRPHYIPKGDT